MTTRRPATAYQRAYHEAGHVVAFAYFGAPVLSASILDGAGDDARNAGGVLTGPHRFQTRIDYAAGTLAGLVAERESMGNHRYHFGHASGDLDLLEAAGFTPHERRTGRIAARRLLSRRHVWRQVEAIATALARHRCLDGHEITAILRSAHSNASPVAQDARSGAIGHKTAMTRARRERRLCASTSQRRRAQYNPFWTYAKNRLHSSGGDL